MVKHTDGQDSPLLSLSDYLRAALQEHASLRDEIKLRIATENATMVGGLAAAVVIVSRVFCRDSGLTLDDLDHSLLLIALPVLWYGMALVLAINMSQVERAGRVVLVVEQKIQSLFEKGSDLSLRDSLDGLLSGLGKAWEQKTGIDARFWTFPVMWETLLWRSDRLFNRPQMRNGGTLLLAFLLCLGGPIALQSLVKDWSWCHTLGWVTGYFVLAVVLWLCLGIRFWLGSAWR
jgi:hypothetical protein